jgi:hypothetical protein
LLFWLPHAFADITWVASIERFNLIFFLLSFSRFFLALELNSKFVNIGAKAIHHSEGMKKFVFKGI